MKEIEDDTNKGKDIHMPCSYIGIINIIKFFIIILILLRFLLALIFGTVSFP